MKNYLSLLGSNQFRYDCYGRANWLYPLRMQADGRWPQDYLDSVYTSPNWKDAWAAFSYLNSKGVVPYFNVSGVVPKNCEWVSESPITDNRISTIIPERSIFTISTIKTN